MEVELVWAASREDGDGFADGGSSAVGVFAEEKSTARQEFYGAMQAGIRVKAVFEVRKEDFALSAHMEGGHTAYARKLKYDGETYDIIRTYSKGKAKIELVCG